ncbi:MAG: T9SS C-terminal target domain-containing protein [Flavobacteriales bacterium TMED191]|nr:MAG: T9SS C-terminal target domain-containing protein [Flavobacteriales bacterium TMED191]|tara:strand:+ start:6120 stop:7571 length:1452 start_codon:yes stop_codon:yes gene_type:complete
MKKLLLFAMCTFFYCSYAQLPPNSFGEDFTLTDINGNEFNLHSTLDEGKTVILDLFATWCGPCWSYAETGVLEDLQQAYPDDVVVVAVEADATTAASTIYNSANGDWTTVIDYLLMDDPSGDVAVDYALAYYPTIYKICPDRMVTEVGQIASVNAFMTEINSCTSAQYSKDARILSYNGAMTFCGGSLDGGSVSIQNYSIGASMTSCDILTKVNGQTVSTTPWSGSIDTYQTATINLSSLNNIPDGANITFEIDYEGDMDSSNNTLNPGILGSTGASNTISLSLTTDNWGSETSWELIGPNGTEASGSGYGNYETINLNWDLTPGCYIFNIYDSYGDGLEASIWGAYDDGQVSLTDNNSGDVIWSAVAYESQGSVAFEVLAQFDISEEQSMFEISLFPNPFKDFTTISINYSKSNHLHRHMPLDDADISVYNNVGKIVYSENITLNPGLNNIRFETNDILPGLYYLNVNFDGKNNLKTLNIIR